MAKPRRLAVLVLDDGELDDVQRMLEEIGAEFGRVRGGAIVPDTPPPRRLLISTPRRIHAVRAYQKSLDGTEKPTRIVVAEGDSNTLRAKLREIGFDYIVRRPVHPEALRLLLLRCLYSGDERRKDPRVPIGYTVSFKSGLLHRKATLADLSCGGCRLLTTYALHTGKRIKLQIPEAVGAAKALSLSGHVLRLAVDAHEGNGDVYVTAVQFDDVGPELRQKIQAIIEARGKGPATLGEINAPPADPRVEQSEPPRAEVKRGPRPDPRVEHDQGSGPVKRERTGTPTLQPLQPPAPPPAVELPEPPEEPLTLGEAPDDLKQVDLEVGVRLEPEPHEVDPEADTKPDLEPDAEAEEQVAEAAEAEADAEAEPVEQVAAAPADGLDESDRRKGPRAHFGRKVPAFGNRALRVLVGRDLSVGGMRVERFPGLEVGDRLHVAIYGDADEEEPLLVWATVARDDGMDGMALVFDQIHEINAQKLEALIASLPAVESLHDDEISAMGTVVGEILET